MPCNLCQYDVVRAEKHRFLLVSPVYENRIVCHVSNYKYTQEFENSGKWKIDEVKVGEKTVWYVTLESLSEFLDFWDTETCGEMFWWSEDGIYEWALVI